MVVNAFVKDFLTMKKLLILLGALAAYGQTVSVSDTLTNAVGGGSYTGRIVVTLNSPGSASPLYYSTTSLTGWQYVLCVGVTGTDCSGTTAAGVVTLTLYANSTITPSGTSYSARFQPAKGSPWSETWVATPSTTTIRAMRSTTVPTPTTTFQASQLALAAGSMVYGSSAGVGTALAAGSNGQVLTLSGGYPSWTTNISGNAGTATALAANGTNCSAGTFPLGVDASGNSESCTALPTTITGTANQITASGSTGAVTLSLPSGGVTLPGKTATPSDSVIIGTTAGGSVTPATGMYNTLIGDHAGQSLVPNLTNTCVGAFKEGTINTMIGPSGWSLTTGCLNTLVGADAGAQLISGVSNTLVGVDAGQLGTAYNYVVAVGQRAAAYNTASETVAIGYATLESHTSGSGNVAVGAYARRAHTSGSHDTAVGHEAMIGSAVASGGDNTAIGWNAGRSISTNAQVTAIGSKALYNYTGNNNGNTAVGYSALYSATNGNANTAIGWGAGYNSTTGGGNTSVGYGSGPTSSGLGNTTTLGYNTTVSADNRVVIGNSSVTDVYMGSESAAANVRATTFTGALTGNASTATALASTVASGRLWIGQGTGVPGSDAGLTWSSSSTKALTVTSSTGAQFFLTDTSSGTTTAKLETGGGYHSFGTTTAHPFILVTNNTERMRLFSSGNIAIGATIDNNYKLEVANSGSSGTARFYDQTATTGSTKVVVRAGAGQSGNLQEWQNSSGTVLGLINSNGEYGNQTTSSYGVQITAVGGYVGLGSAVQVAWSASTPNSTKDLGLARNAAGVLEINNGTAGTYRDLYLRGLTATNTAGTAKLVWDSANERLGVGTASPGYALEAYTTTDTRIVATANATRVAIYANNATGIGYVGTLSNSALSFRVTDADVARFAATTGNLLLATTTDSGYKLEVANSGTSGTARFYDATATTGSTKVVVRAGAGQSGNLQEWQNSAGSALAWFDSAGRLAVNSSYKISGDTYQLSIDNPSNAHIVSFRSDQVTLAGTTTGIVFSNGSNAQGGTIDSGLARNAAGVLEINNGTAGTYRDLIARIYQWTNGTEATCSSTTRGQVVMVQGGAGVADTLRVCAKNSSDVYNWTALY